MIPPRGTVLLAVFLLLLLAWNSGRVFFPEREELPALFVENGKKTIWVELGEGFANPGVHQFYDESALSAVKSMTLQISLPNVLSLDRLRSGEKLSIDRNGSEKPVLIRGWMPAARRIALGVSLHPEAMTLQDWQDLPGIGPRLAERIESDRQENGDFGCYTHLKRVRGIGEKRIQTWEKFFVSN